MSRILFKIYIAIALQEWRHKDKEMGIELGAQTHIFAIYQIPDRFINAYITLLNIFLYNDSPFRKKNK